jgi:uncharacterized OB-fold protein
MSDTLPGLCPSSSDPLNREFWEQCQDGTLRLQSCDECRTFRHIPRATCPACGSHAWSWTPVKGDGTLFSYTVIRENYMPPFQGLVPYVVAVVKLAEGAQLAAALLDVTPEQVTLDMPVKVVVREAQGGKMPFFIPA